MAYNPLALYHRPESCAAAACSTQVHVHVCAFAFHVWKCTSEFTLARSPTFKLRVQSRQICEGSLVPAQGNSYALRF